MIAAFLSSWDLFHNSYLAGWLLALLLPMLGVLVVARDQIFVGAAISQASLLGVALGLWFGSVASGSDDSWLRSDAFLSLCAGALAVLAALLTTWARRARGDSHESVTGWIFLVGSSLSVLILAHSPHGMEEIHRLLSSTIIGATPLDVWVFAAMVALTIAALLRWNQELLLLVMDPAIAEAVGLRVAIWNGALAIWLGIVVGVSNRVAGAIFTFGCLVLPALAARNLCREVRSMLAIAPLLGLAAALPSFVLAHDRDYPPGQTTAFVLCVVLLAAWAIRKVRAPASFSEG